MGEADAPPASRPPALRSLCRPFLSLRPSSEGHGALWSVLFSSLLEGAVEREAPGVGGPLQVFPVLSEQGPRARARGETLRELLIDSSALNALFPNCSRHPKEGGDTGLAGQRWLWVSVVLRGPPHL